MHVAIRVHLVPLDKRRLRSVRSDTTGIAGLMLFVVPFRSFRQTGHYLVLFPASLAVKPSRVATRIRLCLNHSRLHFKLSPPLARKFPLQGSSRLSVLPTPRLTTWSAAAASRSKIGVEIFSVCAFAAEAAPAQRHPEPKKRVQSNRILRKARNERRSGQKRRLFWRVTWQAGLKSKEMNLTVRVFGWTLGTGTGLHLVTRHLNGKGRSALR